MREGTEPTNQRTWRQVIKTSHAKGRSREDVRNHQIFTIFQFRIKLVNFVQLCLVALFSENLYPAASFLSCLQCKKSKYSKIVNTLQTVEISFCQKFQLWVTDEIWSFKLNLCTTTTTVHFKITLAKIDDSFPCERFLDKIWWNIPTEVVGIFRCTYNGEKTCLEFSNLQNPLLLDCPKWEEALTDIRSCCYVIAASYLPFPPLSVFL